MTSVTPSADLIHLGMDVSRDLVDPPIEVDHQVDQAPLPRRRDLPEQRRRHPPRRSDPARHARRMVRSCPQRCMTLLLYEF
jgi:hypothetical protein